MVHRWWRRFTRCCPSWCDPWPARNRQERRSGRGAAGMLDRALDT